MLLKKICGSKEKSYQIGDNICFEMEIREINKVVQATDHFNKPISYDCLVNLTKSLEKIHTMAQSRPQNWTEYCKKHDLEIIKTLHELVLLNQDETIELSFKLLAAYYSAPQDANNEKPNAQDSENNESMAKLNNKEVIKVENILSEKPANVKLQSSWLDITKEYLEKYINDILLNNHNQNIASATLRILINLWNVGNNTQRRDIIHKVISKLPIVTLFGQNAEHLFGLLAHICKSTDWESSSELNELRDQIVSRLIRLTNDMKQKIELHPNHSLYTSLQEFLKDRASSSMRYYLDGEACFRCYEGLNIPYQDLRLNDLKEELKYTSHCVLARLNNSYNINSIIVSFDERNPYRQFKSLSTINVFLNNKPNIPLIDLKNNWNEWKKLVSHTIERKKSKEGEKSRVVIKLPLPSAAKNIMIEFKTQDPTRGLADGGLMMCPICLKKFDNRYGTGRCLSCNESILECRKCGYLAEDKLEGLFCSHCGASRFMNYDIVLSAKIGYAVEKIESEKSREAVSILIILNLMFI